MSDLRAEAIQFVRAGLSVAAGVAKLPGCLEPRVLPPFKLVTVQLKQSEPTEKEWDGIDIGIDFHPELTVYVDFGKVIDRDVLEEVAGSLLHTGLDIDGDDMYITFDLKSADRVLEGYDKAKAAEDALYDPFAEEEVSA